MPGPGGSTRPHLPLPPAPVLCKLGSGRSGAGFQGCDHFVKAAASFLTHGRCRPPAPRATATPLGMGVPRRGPPCRTGGGPRPSPSSPRTHRRPPRRPAPPRPAAGRPRGTLRGPSAAAAAPQPAPAPAVTWRHSAPAGGGDGDGDGAVRGRALGAAPSGGRGGKGAVAVSRFFARFSCCRYLGLCEGSRGPSCRQDAAPGVRGRRWHDQVCKA